MWNRFTELARRAILLAQSEARTHRSNAVDVAHLTLGAMRCEREGTARGEIAATSSSAMLRATVEPPIGFVSQLLQVNGVDVARLEAQLQTLFVLRANDENSEPKLTKDAKRVLELAAAEARHLSCSLIGPEFLLLGALRSNSAVSLVMAEHNLGLVSARRQLHALSQGRDGVEDFGEALLSQRVRELITQSQQQASLVGSGVVGTGHFLLALIHNGEARRDENTIRVLEEAGVSLPEMRQKIKARVFSDNKTGGARPAPTEEMRRALKNAKALAQSRDLLLVLQEHLLLALAMPDNGRAWRTIAQKIGGKTRDCVAFEVLQSYGLDVNTLHDRLWKSQLQLTSQCAENAPHSWRENHNAVVHQNGPHREIDWERENAK